MVVLAAMIVETWREREQCVRIGRRGRGVGEREKIKVEQERGTYKLIDL